MKNCVNFDFDNISTQICSKTSYEHKSMLTGCHSVKMYYKGMLN
jgi:hypothetical protein